MNGSVVAKVIASVSASAIIAVASILWSINSRMAVMEDRMSRLLAHSDRNDDIFEQRIQEIEKQLRK